MYCICCSVVVCTSFLLLTLFYMSFYQVASFVPSVDTGALPQANAVTGVPWTNSAKLWPKPLSLPCAYIESYRLRARFQAQALCRGPLAPRHMARNMVDDVVAFAEVHCAHTAS